MVLHGNSLERLKEFPDNYFDCVVTDPPYGLSFMGKKWDYDVPSVELWREVLRVLKPGGHVLSFGGTRTYHRMVVNIEDAGFEIRDQIAWLYGSGFPKSLDVSKAIDKAAGAEREIVGEAKRSGANSRAYQSEAITTAGQHFKTAPATPDAKKWQGFGTALKPANEPIVVARKPLEKGLTVAENVLKFGTGAMNIDGSRIGTEQMGGQTIKQSYGSDAHFGGGEKRNKQVTATIAQGRWPANVLFDERAAEMLDEQSGQLSQCGGPKKTTHDAGMFGIGTPGRIYTEANRGASRFFYCAKASKSERNAGLDNLKNVHPTIKPIKLMEYLIKLVCPPSGIVLDPFCGSGSTGVAAKRLGFGFVGIEMNAEYVEIAKRRVG